MQQSVAAHAGLTPLVAGATTAAALQLAPTVPVAGAPMALATYFLAYAVHHVACSAAVFLLYTSSAAMSVPIALSNLASAMTLVHLVLSATSFEQLAS